MSKSKTTPVEGQTNPFVLVDEALHDAEFLNLRGNRSGAERRIADCGRQLDGILSELGDADERGGFDLDRITSISGSGGEKMQKIVELHSHLAAAEKARAEVASISKSRNWRERLAKLGVEMDNAPDVDAPAVRGNFREQVEASLDGDLTNLQPTEIGGPGRSASGSAFDIFGANFVTTDGYPPVVTPRPGVDAPDFASMYRPQVFEAFGPMIPTTQNSIKHRKETVTRGSSDANIPAEKAQAAASPEVDIAYTEVTSPIQTIRATLPISEEQLADVPSLRSFLEGRLQRLARRRLDDQLIAGSGTAPALEGILAERGINTEFSGLPAAFTQVQQLTDIRNTLAKVRNNGETIANAIMINPTRWADIQLSNSSGLFTFGSPGLAIRNSLWGTPVIEVDKLADGLTALDEWCVVGDFIDGADLFLRQDAVVDAGYIDKDFTNNLLRLRVRFRVGVAWYNANAFGSVERKALS